MQNESAERRLITEVMLEAAAAGRCPWEALVASVEVCSRASAAHQLGDLDAEGRADRGQVHHV